MSEFDAECFGMICISIEVIDKAKEIIFENNNLGANIAIH